MAFWLTRLPRSVALGRGAGLLPFVPRFFRSGAAPVAEASTSLRSPAALFRDLAAFSAALGGEGGEAFNVTLPRTGSPPADDEALAGSFGFVGRISHKAKKEASAFES